MLAVDTNIVVRFLTEDDPVQSPQARALIASNDVFVSATVLLETEWVLRRGYGYAPARLVAVLRRFGGLPHVTVEDPARITKALDWTEAGMDFADALHLAKASGCDAFISFDAALAKTAQRVHAPPVCAP
jgi:predicted nucleic-acid-binding protein